MGKLLREDTLQPQRGVTRNMAPLLECSPPHEEKKGGKVAAIINLVLIQTPDPTEAACGKEAEV